MQRIVGNVRVNINKSKHALAAVSKMADAKRNMAETVVVLVLFVFVVVHRAPQDVDDVCYLLASRRRDNCSEKITRRSVWPLTT